MNLSEVNLILEMEQMIFLRFWISEDTFKLLKKKIYLFSFVQGLTFVLNGIMEVSAYFMTTDSAICNTFKFPFAIGLPSWLQRDPTMRVRENYEPYLNRVKIYLDNLLPLVADLQFTRGGPIIAAQVSGCDKP